MAKIIIAQKPPRRNTFLHGKDGKILNRETAKQYIRENWRSVMAQITAPARDKANGETSYICPLCGHGTNGDGLTFNPKSAGKAELHCFGCSFSGDIISLYMQTEKSGYNEALSSLADMLGITIDSAAPEKDREKWTAAAFKEKNSIDIPREEIPAKTGAEAAQNEKRDYTGYYRKCTARLEDQRAIEYLNSRGISKETAAAYWIGFDPEADPASAPGGMGEKRHATPRIIIPAARDYYTGRSIDPLTEKRYQKMNSKGTSPAIFNARALFAKDAREVYITEGAFDALSIIEAGSPAIALNSAANADALIKLLEERGGSAATCVLCLDNDDRGKRAENTIRAGLQRLNISYATAQICGGYKDPNEALTGNREAFFEAVERERQAILKPENTSLYINSFMRGDIENFKDEKRTGFKNLDARAGGLYSGLYILAAISGLGKTSFALQLADQLAANGHDVLFFSLEQSRLELVSKSIARGTAQKDMGEAVTSLQIRRGKLYPQVLQAAKKYTEAVGDRLSIIEGNFDCNIPFIGNYIKQYIARTGTRPVVFIDYLQILQPEAKDRRSSAKETIDAAITALKRITREENITLFAISSINRGNYQNSVDFESLKESGAIEYTADVVLGMQLKCLNDPLFSSDKKTEEKRKKIKEEKAKHPREIELTCLKNRYGISSYSCYYDYYCKYDLFIEKGGSTMDKKTRSDDDIIL